MTSGTIRPDGKKHSLVRCFLDIYELMWGIDGVERVIIGRFAEKGWKGKDIITFQYYNATTRTLRINLANRKRRQYFELRVLPENVEYVKQELINLANQRLR